MNSVVTLSGTYDSGSGSGKVLEFDMENLPDGRAVLAFRTGRSATIARLGLMAGPMSGMMFYVSSAEFEDFKNNVLGKGKQWVVTKEDGASVEIPGTWNTVSGGRRANSRKSKSRKTNSRKSRKTNSRKSRKSKSRKSKSRKSKSRRSRR